MNFLFYFLIKSIFLSNLFSLCTILRSNFFFQKFHVISQLCPFLKITSSELFIYVGNVSNCKCSTFLSFSELAYDLHMCHLSHVLISIVPFNMRATVYLYCSPILDIHRHMHTLLNDTHIFFLYFLNEMST